MYDMYIKHKGKQSITYLKNFMMEEDLALIELAYFRFCSICFFSFTQCQPAVLIPILYNRTDPETSRGTGLGNSGVCTMPVLDGFGPTAQRVLVTDSIS
jgi:hypothetical protein